MQHEYFWTQRWVPAFLEFIKHAKVPSKELVKPGPITLYGAQMRLLEEIDKGLSEGQRFFVLLKARQLGASTFMLLLDVFWLYLFPGLQGALVADTDENRIQFRETITQVLESLPPGFRIPIKRHNRAGLVLENDSRLQYMVAGKGKNPDLGRSRGLNFVHGTELSSWGDQDGIKSLIDTLATENPNRLYIFESTAKGYNTFYDIYRDAKADPTQRAIFIGWWAKELYRIRREGPEFERWWGKQPDLTESEQAMAQIVFEDYGWTIDAEQWAWWRKQTFSRGEQNLLQELPWCVSGETRVGTSRGILKIEDVRPGDIGTLGSVLEQGPTGVRPMFRLRTERGYELRGTAEHPIALERGGFCDLAASTGEEVALEPPRFSEVPYTHRWRAGVIEHAVEITPDLARFIGIFMGDGCISARQGGYYLEIAFDAQDHDVIEDTRRLVDGLFGVTMNGSIIGKNKGGYRLRVGSRLIYETLKELGLTRTDTMYTMRKVHVPEVIWRSPKPVVREFLRGLFETDGHMKRDGYGAVFFSKHAHFTRDVQLLLLGFGITSTNRSSVKRTIAGRGGFKQHEYQENVVRLRQSEVRRFAAEIGFLGARKQSRAEMAVLKPVPKNEMKLVLRDRVASITPDGEDQAWNITVGGSHQFDAYGLLTHNCEKVAFQVTGTAFFSAKRLGQDMEVVRGGDVTFSGYRYTFGDSFLTMRCDSVQQIAEADLRIWEPPVKNARYVLGVDVAFGRNANNDRQCVEVYRCFADKLVQVAEWATPMPESRCVAWVMAHLAGSYRDCMVNLEVSGPGLTVMTEIKYLRQQIAHQHLRPDLQPTFNARDALDQARWYLYHRPDTPGQGYMLNWQTNSNNKQEMMNGLRDEYSIEHLIIRSLPLLEEMKSIVQDGVAIQASGRNKDDRVFASGLACQTWRDWIRLNMIQENRTYALEMAKQAQITEQGGAVVDGIIPAFFRKAERERKDREFQRLLEG